jgi:hypothetical protein
MKKHIKQFVPKGLLSGATCLVGMFCYLLFATGNPGYAQDSTASAKQISNPIPAQDSSAPAKPAGIERVKNTFLGTFIIDNQSVMVPVKKTLEFTIQHRFGTINNKYNDFFGLFAGANVRFGASYTPINNMQVGVGLCEDKMQWDGNIKYALSKQAVNHGCPVSVTYYGNMAVSTLPKKGNFVSNADRISYFSQLIVARKITEHFSVQASPSYSYFNNVEGYMSSEGTIKPKMKNGHCAVAAMGCYTFTEKMGVIVNYDQPLTQHPTNNPHPNISFGIQIATFTHTFQIFLGNYQSILPQANNLYNQNDYTKSQYCIGFNITKRWNYF